LLTGSQAAKRAVRRRQGRVDFSASATFFRVPRSKWKVSLRRAGHVRVSGIMAPATSQGFPA
jgi:hypothetical protein